MRTGDGISASLLEALRNEGLHTVEGAFAYAGGRRMTKPGLRHRARVRLELTDAQGQAHELYMKLYGRQPLAARIRQRIRQWLTRRSGSSPAGIEWANIQVVRSAGIRTMRPVIAGEQPDGTEAPRSYIIVTAVPGRKLEECMKGVLDANRDRPGVMEEFTGELAELVRKLHQAGYVHRDLYASHVFLNEAGDGRELYLIDLARVFAPRWRRTRWQVKDLAQLKSSLGMEEWAGAWWPQFLRRYLASDDPRVLGRWRRMVDRKADLICLRRRKRMARAAR